MGPLFLYNRVLHLMLFGILLVQNLSVTAQCPNLITNGDFSAGASSWTHSYPSSPISGPIFYTNFLEIWVDNDGSLHPGNVFLKNTTSFTLTNGGVYAFAVKMKRTNDIISACNFKWVILNSANAIVLTLGNTYTTGGNGASGAVTIPNGVLTNYKYCFTSNLPTGSYQLALTWESFEDGMGRDVIIDDIVLNEFKVDIQATGNIGCGQPTAQLSIPVCPDVASIVWTGPGITSGQGTSNIVVNTGGAYQVVVTGSTSSCSGTATYTVTQNGSGPLLNASCTHVDASCSNGNVGSATAVPSGGTAPYSFQWSTTPVQTTATASNLSPGTYSCVVTDINGCQDTVTATILSLSPNNTITPSLINVNCFGEANGSASLSVSGGSPPFTFSWNTTPVQTTATASGLSAGQYTCTITDALGCPYIKIITITEPPALLAQTMQKDIRCNGEKNGEASVLISGGVSPYTYTWSPVNSTTNSINGLAAGTYTCTITDAHSCNIIKPFTITEPAVLTANPSQNNVVCYGGATGSASVLVSGGVSPYTYNWQPAGGTGANASSLTAGTYTCTLTDANNCLITKTVTITEPPALAITSTIPSLPCHNSTGTASVNVSGGVPPYTYVWLPSGGIAATSGSLSAGSYTCTIIDSMHCTDKAVIVITAPSLLHLSLNGPSGICKGSSATVTVSASGGTPAYTYSWNGSPYNSITQQVIYPMKDTLIIVELKDNNNCTFSDSVLITIKEKPLIQFGQKDSGCVALSVTFNNTSTGASSYLWNFGDGTTSTLPQPVHVYNTPGWYHVSLVGDNGGCKDSLLINRCIHAFPLAYAAISAQSETVSEINPEIQFINSSQGQDECWLSFGDGASVNSCGNVSHSYQSPGVYTVTLIASNQYHCNDTATLQVRVTEESTLYVPNAFSPNQDKINDIFFAYGTNIFSFEMRIFDRWGLEIFSTKNLAEGWNGTYGGSEAQEDVYIYSLKYKDIENKPYSKRGAFTLIR